MSFTTIQVPEGISWVAGSLFSVPLLLSWQMIQVGGSRKKAGIPYPRLYAEKAEQDSSVEALKFNCAQRAHQNTLENIPTILILTLLSSIEHPKIAASALGVWVLGRVLYTSGYKTGDPAKRNRGSPSYLGLLTLLGTSGKVVYDLFMAGL